MKNHLVILGHLSLIVTAILAIVFYKERVLYVDPGTQVFEMINEGGYKVYVSRYSMMINQTFPLLAIKMGASLKTIMLVYSLSFVFIYYLAFVISVHCFKNIAAGLSIAFVPLVLRLAFGHSISEAWLGMAYSAVFYALLNHYVVWKKKGGSFIFLFYVLIILVVAINYFIHPITLFTLGFALAFTWFYKKENRGIYLYIVSFLVLCVYMYKFFFPGTTHEESFFAGVKQADVLLPKLFNLPLIQFLGGSMDNIYWSMVILGIVTGIFFWRQRKLWTYGFLVTFCGMYVIIAALAFYKGDAPFALESRLIPLAFFVAIGFAEATKELKRNYLISGGLVIMLFFSYLSLVRHVKRTQSRRLSLYAYMLKESEKYPGRKFYVRLPKDRSTPVNSWGSSTETLLLSSLNGKEGSRTIMFCDADLDVQKGLEYWDCVFLWVPWYLWVHETRMLNPKYFDLKCTKYRELPYPDNF